MYIIKALIISFIAHLGQKDKANKPYILHPLTVAYHSKGYKAKVVALLHDVVEDSYWSLKDLQKYFDNDIVIAVDCITKNKKYSYDEYLERVKGNNFARIVKLSDLMHNSNLSRLKNITKEDIKRTEKYLKAIDYLSF